MLDILEELTKRTSYYLTVDYKDSMYDHVIDSKESIVLIMPERWFKTEYNHNPQKIAGYHLAGLFDLGEVYSPNISLRFTVYYFTKLKPETFKTGVFLDTLQNDEQIRHNGHAGVSYPVLPQSFPDKVYCYLEAIERWVNEGKRPKNTFYANYNELALSDFHYEKPYALRYTANSIRIQKMLSSEEVVPLSDLADIFEPPLDNLTEGTVIYLYNHDEFTYPLKKEYFRETYIGVPNFKIKKGDILLSSAAEGYQINFVPDEIAEDIYCPGLTIIVRAKEGVSPEYIFLYLKSETGKTIISPYNHGAVIKHIPANEISRLPIIPPKRSAKQYRKLFEDIFIAQNRLDVFSECFQPQEVDSIENILNDELCAKALICRNKLAKEMISSDLQEIQSCFEAKAYKATLILAGSVLEAFLIDWLSEMERKDYFSERILNEEGKECSLLEIINRIKDIKAPKWATEANYAHTIRKKRNLVHAKLCLKETAIIDDTLCFEVVKYLKQIIDTRYGKKPIQ